MESFSTKFKTVTNNFTNPSLCPDLDLKTRIVGFLLTFILGIVMMFGSIAQLFSLALGGQRWFAIWYTAGNIVSLSSSFFLMGPKKQCEMMMNPVRATVSIILGGSMIACVLLALLGFSKLLVLVAIGVQFCSLVWYVLSYIPQGREVCGGCLKRMIFGNSSSNSDESGYSKV